MHKSFKKAIAVLLTVLMTVFSVPFTALAAAGDYAPDFDLRFGTFYDFNNAAPEENFFFNSAFSAAPDLSLSGTQGPALDYDKTAGTLTLKAAKTQALANEILEDPTYALTEDYTVQAGDYITVTTLIHGVDSIAVARMGISYSDNIEPAGYYTYKGGSTGKTTRKGWGTLSEGKAAYETELAKYPKTNGFTWSIGGTNPLTGSDTPFSCGDLYGDQINNQDGGPMDDSVIKDTADGKTYMDSCSIQSGGGDVSVMQGDVTDPETGSYGYQYAGADTVVLETFLFKVTGDGPITFDVYDKDNTKLTGFAGGYYFKQGESAKQENYTTYAVNTVNSADGQENPGSRKMTFMGTNANNQTETKQYTITFVDAAGNTVDTQTVDEGTTPVVPSTTTSAKFDESWHYSYAWPEVAAAAADATYKEVETKAAHVYGDATVAKEATCTETGDNKYTCDCGYSYVATGEIPATGHAYTGEWIVDKEATEEEAGSKHKVCANGCGIDLTEEIPMLAHTHVAGDTKETVITDATCEEAGEKKVETLCSKCGEVIADLTKTETIPAKGHAWKVTEEAVPATCETHGKTAVETCQNDATHVRGGEAIEAKGHAWKVTEEAVPATCETPGKTAVETCQNDATHVRGGEAIEAKGHVWETVETIPATKKDPAKEVQVCKNDATHTQTIEVGEALGVKVTVEDVAGLGTVTGLNYGDNKVAYGAAYTVTAAPLEGAEFIGWEINGKVVSTDATYSSVAINDVTLTPMFDEVGQDRITVTFFDMYGNVVDQISGTVAEVQANIKAPDAPSYPGYTFVGWSVEDLTAIDMSTSVYAQYEVNTNTGYTVTVPADVELTLPENVENGSIPYDAKVTVSKEGVEAWKVDGTVVGYGSSFTFFVGADVTVEPVYESVVAAPAVAMVSTTQVEGSHKVQFLATRTVPAGFTLVNAGFVYGKNLVEADLDLDKVGQNGSAADAGVVKVAYASKNGSDQFALNYGIKSMKGNAVARAFVVYQQGSETIVTYSDVATFTYGA